MLKNWSYPAFRKNLRMEAVKTRSTPTYLSIYYFLRSLEMKG
ncbi:MAG: hypothetical protein QXK12_04450 [Candidatus Nezhaarchaeales archaeon]